MIQIHKVVAKEIQILKSLQIFQLRNEQSILEKVSYSGKFSNDFYILSVTRSNFKWLHYSNRFNLKIFQSCSGEGYWVDDFITRDEYYIMAPNEKCSFSCDSNIIGGPAVLSESYGYWNTLTCRGDKGLLDDIDWQHNWRQMPSCIPVETSLLNAK